VLTGSFLLTGWLSSLTSDNLATLEHRQPWPTADVVLGNDLQTSHDYVKALHIDTHHYYHPQQQHQTVKHTVRQAKAQHLMINQSIILIFV